MKKKYLMTSLALALAGCASTDNNGTAPSGSGSDTSVAGTYYANLPCKRCNSTGVVIDLVLERDNTYSLMSHPKNSNDEYVESGTWLKNRDTVKLTRNASLSDNNKPFTVAIKTLRTTAPAQLTLLNANGSPYSKDASRYTFDKK